MKVMKTPRFGPVLLLALFAWAVPAAPPPPIQPPTALAGALAAGDPLALADTSLPRLRDLSGADRARLAAFLSGWSPPRRVAALAFLQVGTPYRGGPLGEETAPDTDPVVAFEYADCTVMNLLAEALAHAPEAGGERAAMARAHYRNGVVSFENRLHFTTDRLDVSPYDRDITRRVAGSIAVCRTVTLNRKSDGSRWIPIDWTRERRVCYVPMRHAARLARWFAEGRIASSAGIAFVQARHLGNGLDVVHEGLIWKGTTLVHASSREGRVVAVPWTGFVRDRGRSYDGFVLFEYL